MLLRVMLRIPKVFQKRFLNDTWPIFISEFIFMHDGSHFYL